MTPARWILSPTLERERSDAAQAARRTACVAWLGAAGMVLICPVSCVGIANGPLGLVPAAIYAFLVARAWNGAAQRRDEARVALWQQDADAIEEFGWGDGWLVDLYVLQGAAPTGQDRGMLWFEDGRMVFSGRRTSFSLGADSVEGHAGLTTPIPGLRHEVALQLRERTRAGPLGISLRPVARAKWQANGSAADVQARIETWMFEKCAPGGQLPPFEIGPGAPTPSHLFAKFVLASGFWILAPLAFAGLLLANAPGFAAAILATTFGMVFFAISLWHPVLRYRAWRDRAQVERR